MDQRDIRSGMTEPANYIADNLQRLNHADLAVAEGDTDVRGWGVTFRDGRDIGKVDDLIVDTGVMKVRYLEVDPDRSFSDTDEPFYVPVKDVDLDHDENLVILRNSDISTLHGFTTGEMAGRFGRRAAEHTDDVRGATNRTGDDVAVQKPERIDDERTQERTGRTSASGDTVRRGDL